MNRGVELGLLLNASSINEVGPALLGAEGSAADVLEARVWLTDGSMDPAKLPEAQLLKNAPGELTGVCLSGGGSRAAAAAIGFLRGLLELGLIEQLDLISACSGGAYTLMPFQYYRSGAADDTELLGPPIDAEKLTAAALASVPPVSLLRQLAVPILSRFMSELLTPACLDGSAADEAWQCALSSIFLKPYGLAERGAIVAADEAHAREIRARNPHLAGVRAHTRRPGRPFDIYAATLAPPTVAPASGGGRGSRRRRAVIWATNDFVPYDMTPLYCGSALSLPHGARFRTYSSFARAIDPTLAGTPDATRSYALGGMVESFAVGCTLAPTELIDVGAAVGEPARARCRRLAGVSSDRGMSLGRMLDATSNAYCGITNNTGAREAVLGRTGLDIGAAYTRLNYWSPCALASPRPARAELLSVGVLPKGTGVSGAVDPRTPAPATESVFISDAGGHDLAAILPMLTRSVKRVVAFLSLGLPIRASVPLEGGPSGTDWSGAEGDLDGQLPAYFGIRARNCEHMMHSLSHVQVFAPADFWKLMRAVRAKLDAGAFPIIELEHKVGARALPLARGTHSPWRAVGCAAIDS
jgi:hypothetical protein